MNAKVTVFAVCTALTFLSANTAEAGKRYICNSSTCFISPPRHVTPAPIFLPPRPPCGIFPPGPCFPPPPPHQPPCEDCCESCPKECLRVEIDAVAGQEIKIKGRFFGKEQGYVDFRDDDIRITAEIVAWDKTHVIFKMPNIDICESTEIDICVYREDGKAVRKIIGVFKPSANVFVKDVSWTGV